MSLSERQAELVDTHRAIQDADLPYVLVGGWAVSAFQTRITVDVDMVIPESSLEDYDALLGELGYQKESDTDVSNIYEGRMVQYVKPVGEKHRRVRRARECTPLSANRRRVVLRLPGGAQRRQGAQRRARPEHENPRACPPVRDEAAQRADR